MMAFHVACPITCRQICYCSLGFPGDLQNDKGKNEFLEEIASLKAFLDDPWLIKGDKKTVQVLVPKVAVVPPPVPPQVTVISNSAVVDGDAAEEMLSAQNKRAAMQKKAAAASLVAEDYARRFESGETEGVTKDAEGEEQGFSNAKSMCRLCFSGENERSEKAKKMLSCKSCNKKYHRSCLKSWAHDRDLFHWSSWSCPSCRVCEVCRRTGDPNKLMFCKRCDGAYHCYCQHPPHKNVGRGPYLCPKHTKCHSCASTVPGNGSSLRWFLGYTCCDACGRLFVKGNYCPVCLKVYRDSESTPMVCCDICQRWVHCQCDGISDEKYLQFQVNNHLRYTCATCRGECYQVRDLEDAVQELWRRRDKSEQDLIAELRSAAGLPTEEEIFSIPPYSDEEEDDKPALKKEYGHSLKFSLKGIVPKKSSNKKHGKEKGFRIEQSDTGCINKDEEQPGLPIDQSKVKHKIVSVKSDGRILREKMKNDKVDESVKEDVKGKGTKLVLHLGGRNKKSPRADASTTTLNGEKALGPRKEVKPLLKVKLKNPYSNEESCWASPGEEDKSCVKGQRSKRKRASSSSFKEDGNLFEDKDTIMDANWIIQKLGKHAIGKKVQVHHPPNNSWHKGRVIEVSEDMCSVSVTLDDGKLMNVDLSKQGIRFVSQKHRQ